MPILSAASPVEIMARADNLGLPAPAREAALALFHTLTSREELAAMDVPDGAPADGQPGAHGGGRWPVHGFLFGSDEELAPVLESLQRHPGAADLAAGQAEKASASPVLFLSGHQAGFAGVLMASADAKKFDEVVPGFAAFGP